jgi:hypothetical protein
MGLIATLHIKYSHHNIILSVIILYVVVLCVVAPLLKLQMGS